MNFAAFQFWREQNLSAQPDVLDCGETNLYRVLGTLQPKPGETNGDHSPHRCDLARAWMARYGFSPDHSQDALVCRGVRHALALIFRELARMGALLWVPNDVYPAYLELAGAAGIDPRLYPTLPEPKIPNSPAHDRSECLLVTNPWKPLGRFLTDDECICLLTWLEKSPSRHLLLDCVYDLNTPFHVTTLKLHATGRAILLHSVTKGWLWPKTFGVALMDRSHLQFGSSFRNDSPTLGQLRLAEQLLTTDASCPDRVVTALESRAERLFNLLPDSVCQLSLQEHAQVAPGCYFFPVAIKASELWRQHRIIAIPAEVFGANWDGSILTSLAMPASITDGGAP